MVTIIPKASPKNLSQQQLLLYISVGLLVVVLVAYFILINLEKRASDAIGSLEKEIDGVASKEDERMKEEVLSAKEKIEDFSLLLANHRKPSKFFEFLEGITHPNVGFTEVELYPTELRAQLQGFSVPIEDVGGDRTDSTVFEAFGQQMYIFQEQRMIRGANVLNLSLGSKGEGSFTVELFLDPQLF